MPLLARLLASADRLHALADDLTASGDDTLAAAARRAADRLDDEPLADASEPLHDGQPALAD